MDESSVVPGAHPQACPGIDSVPPRSTVLNRLLEGELDWKSRKDRDKDVEQAG